MRQPTLSKKALKKYLDGDSEITLERRKELKRYLDARVSYRDSEKELKSYLKKTIAPYISKNYQPLIGVVEKQLNEAFYDMDINEVKYYKHLPKNNYIDYLNVKELTGLRYLKRAMIYRLNTNTRALSIESLCYTATEVGKEVRKWFIEKYNVAPENLPADEVSYTVCKSSRAKLDKVITTLTEAPRDKKVESNLLSRESESPKKSFEEDNPLLETNSKGQIQMKLNDFVR